MRLSSESQFLKAVMTIGKNMSDPFAAEKNQTNAEFKIQSVKNDLTWELGSRVRTSGLSIMMICWLIFYKIFIGLHLNFLLIRVVLPVDLPRGSIYLLEANLTVGLTLSLYKPCA